MDGRKIAVLGDMLELGPYEKQGHEMVGVRAAEVCSQLVTVGERGKMIAEAAQASGRNSLSVSWFATVSDVIEVLKSKLLPGDVVLIKGSHSMRMDRIVMALEAES